MKLLDRLKKLWRLANDKTGNVNECAAAAAKLTKLMLEHGIQKAELELGEDQDCTMKHVFGGKGLSWKSQLLACLAGTYGCKAFRRAGQGVLLGPADNVAAVHYQWQWLHNEIVRLAKEAGHPNGGREWNSFCHGAVYVICQRVKAQFARTVEHVQVGATPRQSQALARVTTPPSDEACKAALGIPEEQKVHRARQNGPTDARAFVQGMEAGRSVDLSRDKAALGAEKACLSAGGAR